ncbi:unnamed protein product, partial [Tetraodon nigroviridis]
RVQLTKAPGESLGISIMGGKGMGRRLSSGKMMRGVFITHINPDSPAAQHGTLQIGNRILEVCVYVCVCVCVCVCMGVHVRMYVHVCMYANIVCVIIQVLHSLLF